MNQNIRTIKKESGFSLIEMMVVSGIIAILVTVAIPTFSVSQTAR